MSILDKIKKFFSVHSDLRDFLIDLAVGLAAVAVIMVVLYAYAGTWPPIVSIMSDSMTPHMDKGDLVILQGIQITGVHTKDNASGNYTMFDEPGDVIIYHPYGFTNLTPVIHRAVGYVHQGDPMWPGGPSAPWDGYITRGDANPVVDQEAQNICYLEPVKKEWIIGTARYRIPYVGYIRALLPV